MLLSDSLILKNKFCKFFLTPVLIIGVLVWPYPSEASQGAVFRSGVYDLSIRKWSSVYTPEYPWYWNKAQLIAESNLNPNARSPVGAMGLGQFMPNTWKDMERQLKIAGSAYSPSLSIQANAYYMRQLRNQFKRDRPEYDKHSLALASYNAGLGNILKAQREGGNSLMYSPMINSLPKITGSANARETRTYVNRIWEYIDILKGIYE